jgi:hypothetical protein
MKKKVLFYLTFVLISFISCNTTEPPSDKVELLLKVEDVSCAETWLALTTTNLQLPITIELKQDDQVRTTINLTKGDTLLYIDSLLPNKTYTFQVFIHSSNQSQVSSNEVTAIMMDTTSHNFTWQTFTFGEHSSSTVYDIAIIDENNIWAVGEIYLNDTLGNPISTRYNAAIWDGQNWSIQRIPYYYQGQLFYHPIQSVLAFGPNDMWFCGNGVIHWDGNSFVPIIIPNSLWGPYQMNKIWGTSSNDLYVVGNNGKIAFYNGQIWQKIESGSTTNINDIWGISNSNDNRDLILCTVSSRFQSGDYKLLALSSGTAQDTLNWNFERLYGVWFNSNRNIYVVGDDIHLYINNQWEILNLTDYFLTRVKGTALNDVYVSGCCNTLFHFNGVTWREIEGIYGEFEGLDAKEDLITAVGWTNAQAVILLGKRAN